MLEHSSSRIVLRTFLRGTKAINNDLTAIYEKSHIVQFYDSDETLLKNIKSFIGGGILAGDPCVVIASKTHHQQLESQLLSHGIDIPKYINEGLYLALDANEVLNQFMIKNRPDKRRFNKVLDAVLSQMGRGGRTVRAYGEMVSILAAEGNFEGAILLEEYWCELANKHSFTLFCAYPKQQFEQLQETSALKSLERITCLHTHVIEGGIYGGAGTPSVVNPTVV